MRAALLSQFPLQCKNCRCINLPSSTRSHGPIPLVSRFTSPCQRIRKVHESARRAFFIIERTARVSHASVRDRHGSLSALHRRKIRLCGREAEQVHLKEVVVSTDTVLACNDMDDTVGHPGISRHSRFESLKLAEGGGRQTGVQAASWAERQRGLRAARRARRERGVRGAKRAAGGGRSLTAARPGQQGGVPLYK